MPALVTIKFTAREFDDIRQAVKEAQEHAGESYRILKAEGASQAVYSERFDFAHACERLLNGPLS